MQNAHRCVHKIIVQGSKCTVEHTNIERAPFNHTKVQKNYFHESGLGKRLLLGVFNPTYQAQPLLSSPRKFLLLGTGYWVLGTGCLGGSAITTYTYTYTYKSLLAQANGCSWVSWRIPPRDHLGNCLLGIPQMTLANCSPKLENLHQERQRCSGR